MNMYDSPSMVVGEDLKYLEAEPLSKSEIKQLRQFINWSNNPKSDIKALYSCEIWQAKEKGIIKTYVKFFARGTELCVRELQEYVSKISSKPRYFIEFEGDKFVME